VTPLGDKLAALIRANGPMTVADYMAACLGDPQHGYYMRHEPFGRGGDFVTAPEVSQIFGELIGLWAVETWQRMGAPARFVFAEPGPGRGTLISDALRAAHVRRRFVASAEVHLVETSPRLREVQRATLKDVAVTWHDRIEDIPAGPMIVIANEFFDALPVRQFVRTGDGWAERMVGLDADGHLAFGLRPSPSPVMPGLVPGIHANTGSEERKGADGRDKPTHDGEEAPVIEVSPARAAVMTGLAERLARDGGAALIIDYGYEGPAFGDTLQAVREHRYDDPLAYPGEADITAHVDFGALAGAARNAGAVARPVMTQGEFLARLGIGARAEVLARGKDEATRASLAGAVERLAGKAAMGDLFKVLAVSSPGLALAVFDEDAGAP
jgi:NADH dehydrogenase [ubiquinone] 1 alpha subcomplex assembly factor 7